MKIAVCEDEKEISEILSNYIDKYMKTTDTDYSIDVYSSAEDYKKSFITYDLLFLDYELPDMNGMELARELRRNNLETGIIFVSAYDTYVFESFEVNTFRYILKPIQESAIVKALKSFMALTQKERYIEVPTARKDNIVSLSDIIYIESDGKYSIVRMINNCFYKSTKSISTYEEEINEYANSFFRTHRRFIVNLEYIGKVNGTLIVFRNGENAEISRRNVAGFNKRYTEYLKKSAR